jgi:hypothetical protein
MAFTFFQGGRNHPKRGFQPNYTATVASATNDFMEDFENLAWDELRTTWIRMYDKTIEWYTNEWALARPTASKVPFHAFIATVQLATTPHLLKHIDAGQVTEEKVVTAVRGIWRDFAFKEPESDQSGRVGIVFEKQNSTLFWSAQRRWLASIRGQLGLRDTDTVRP